MAEKVTQLEVTTKNYLDKITALANQQELKFEGYQKDCVKNAIITVDNIIRTSKYSWENFDKNNVFSVLNQVAFLEVNPSATPRECYFIIRNTKNPTTNSWYPVLEFGIEGAGNDVILKNFGNVKRIKSYIVYQGDEFVEGYEDGWETKLPKYTRTFKSVKPEKVVYLLLRKDGETDVVYATLDDVKKSLLGHVRQNGATDEIINEMDTHTLDELLDPSGKWVKMQLQKIRKIKVGNTWKDEKYSTPLISPAWTSPVSRDNMIERKLRNHATRKYPKYFKTPYIQEKYEQTFDEKYDRTNIIEATPQDHVDNAEIEFQEKNASEELVVTTKAVKETKPNPDAGEILVIKPQQEDDDSTTDEPEEKPEIIDPTEEPEPEYMVEDEPEETTEEPSNEETPSWFQY